MANFDTDTNRLSFKLMSTRLDDSDMQSSSDMIVCLHLSKVRLCPTLVHLYGFMFICKWVNLELNKILFRIYIGTCKHATR